MREVATDDRKMKELILYLASKSEEDPRFSSTKLNKLPFGPAPKAVLSSHYGYIL
jgi:hypothetical protein